MGLSHTTYVGYGFEIPATTDFEHLDQVLADQPDAETLGRVQHTYLGDYEHLFLLTECTELEENDAVAITGADYQRPELGGWIAALHDTASRLGHPNHPLPAWLVLHDHS